MTSFTHIQMFIEYAIRDNSRIKHFISIIMVLIYTLYSLYIHS